MCLFSNNPDMGGRGNGENIWEMEKQDEENKERKKEREGRGKGEKVAILDTFLESKKITRERERERKK